MLTSLIFSVFISLAYLILISSYRKGWMSLPEYHTEISSPDISVSVIVAFRDEEDNLPVLLKALTKQSYPKSAYEIIFADDHSEDRSVSIVDEFIASGGCARLVTLGKSDQGKKKALALAASEANGMLLIFTDADCLPGRDWIKTMVACYQENKPILIAAPVVIQSSPGFFNRFQSLELFSLIGTTGGAFGIGKPIIVNGANLAVQKDIYLENINFLQNRTPSGDDVFILLRLKNKFPGKLVFLKSLHATVSVKPNASLYGFLQQRLRWTSKSRFYRDKSIIASAILVLLINLWLLICFIISFYKFQFIVIWAGIFFAKTMIDFIFLKRVLKFFGKESLLKNFVLSQFLYFLYISFTGIAGNLISSKWKGRTV